MRPDDFKQHRPKNKMAENFPYSGHLVMRPHAEPAMHTQDGRQRARNEQGVVKPKTKQSEMRVRFEPPTVQHIESATTQAERIEQVTKPFHSRDKISQPDPRASNSLKTKISMKSE